MPHGAHIFDHNDKHDKMVRNLFNDEIVNDKQEL
jgi:hypothetical protein